MNTSRTADTHFKQSKIVIRSNRFIVYVIFGCKKHTNLTNSNSNKTNHTFFHILLVPILYHCTYGCVFCILRFNFLNYVILLLCLCIHIVMYC